ncbi:MAG: PilN domain-containing protein [Bradymonadaceae bacterium]
MIRVNLLPVEKARRRSAGRMQLVVFGFLLVAELVGFGFLYVDKKSQADRLAEKVDQKETKVENLKEEVKGGANYEKKAEKLQTKLDVLKDIEKKSAGPLKVLRELQVVLSRPENLEERYAQRRKNWNVEWNPNNLWIENLKETGGDFELEGRAMGAEDVAEFLHRLETARHFQNVQLNFVKPVSGRGSGAKVVKFTVDGKIQYGDGGGSGGSEGKSGSSGGNDDG